jgi:phosphomannomutase
MSVFHAYDVRGLCPGELDEDIAYHSGHGLARLLGPGPVGIAWDMRPTGPALVEAMARGLREAGRDVVRLGMITTPTFYYAVGHLDLAGGAIVTASHNPSEYNGFKLTREAAIPIGGNSGLVELERAVAAKLCDHATTPGQERHADVIDEYLDHVLSCSGGAIGPLSIAIDNGNGVAGPTIERLFSRLPQVNLTKLFFEPDGRFPNHEANPLKLETLDTLRARVRDDGLQLGIAFDGDGDRAAFVDEQGGVVQSDLLTAFLATELLRRHGPATMVYDLRSSIVVRESIEAGGGEAIEERVGHAFIKKTMRSHDALFGGELSGHYYWRDNFYADSALMAVAHVLAIVSREGRPLSELIAPFRRTSQSGERNFRVADKGRVLAALEAHHNSAALSRLDGLTARYDDWWFNVRTSNTEPLLRLNVEAPDPETLKARQSELEAFIESVGQ